MIEKISGDTAYFEAALTSEELADLLSDAGIRLVHAWGGYQPDAADLEKLNDLFRLRPEIEFCATEPGQLGGLRNCSGLAKRSRAASARGFMT